MSIQTQAQSKFINSNGIKLHYLDYPGAEPMLILLHGLSANAWSLDPLARKLSPHFHVLSVDLRGRGLSDKPASGYSMDDHAKDVIAMIDGLGKKQVVLGGHSFGGFLALYVAAQYPEHVSRLVLLDAGLTHPKVGELIGPSLARLGKTWPSWEGFLQLMKQSPAMRGFWDSDMEHYYRADVMTNADGSVTTRATAANITEASAGLGAVNWVEIFGKVEQEAILVNAPGPCGPDGTPAVIPGEQGRMTASMLPHCQYVEVPGNHYTMLWSMGVGQMAAAVETFLNEP
ncbi:MAG TPA: alpha/beta hydrolase [Aggregatilineales bacterium]|nr:alpha/beta hydrolase [Aggregatilineales bacterium]